MSTEFGIASVDFVEKGARYGGRADDFGFCMRTATEDGYIIRLIGGHEVVFLPESIRKSARKGTRKERANGSRV